MPYDQADADAINIVLKNAVADLNADQEMGDYMRYYAAGILESAIAHLRSHGTDAIARLGFATFGSIA